MLRVLSVRIIFTSVLAFWTATAAAAATPVAGRRVFRPQSYGAKGDGAHNDTVAVAEAAAATAACGQATDARERCTLLIAGGTFLTGPVALPSNSVITVQAGATLLAATMSQWNASGWVASAFLIGHGLQNVTINGTGTIDGNGAEWWGVTHDDLHYRPNMMALGEIVGLVIEDVLLLNSPNHNICLYDCAGVRVRRLHVQAPHDSPNTDGINIGGGSDQSIVDSHISNGDDCVSILPGGVSILAPARAGGGQIPAGGNVVVRNLTCDGGHGISIGSIRHGYISNVTVSSVQFHGGECGCRIKTYPNNQGL